MRENHVPRIVSRREFITQGIVGAAIGTTALASVAADKQPRPTTIIDTHTHFYDPFRPQGVPWPGKDEKLLYRTVLPKHYKALPTPQPVTGTVVVEASAWVEDNQWILDLAKDDPFIVGFVGNLPVGTDAFRGQLERFATNQLFRGLRIGGGRLREGLSQPRFLADLKLVSERDLSLDLLGGPDILPDVSRLAQEIPTLRLIIDHVANLKIDGKPPPDEWRRGMDAAAKHKNVFCKVSALVEGTGRTDGTAPRDVEYYKPVLDAVWQAFDADRLIYGSNWPVSERFASCGTVQAIMHDYFQTKGKAATEKVFSKNAKVFYKWIKR